MLKSLDNDIIILIKPILNKGNKKHILIIYNKLVFYINNGKKTFWESARYQPFYKKDVSLSLHISNFLIEIDGQLKFE